MRDFMERARVQTDNVQRTIIGQSVCDPRARQSRAATSSSVQMRITHTAACVPERRGLSKGTKSSSHEQTRNNLHVIRGIKLCAARAIRGKRPSAICGHHALDCHCVRAVDASTIGVCQRVTDSAQR
jgi:hypothetical protein